MAADGHVLTCSPAQGSKRKIISAQAIIGWMGVMIAEDDSKYWRSLRPKEAKKIVQIDNHTHKLSLSLSSLFFF